jgi:hypothetical protein
LAKDLGDVAIENLVGNIYYDLPAPKNFPKPLPFEQVNIGEKRVVTMPEGSLKRLYTRVHICSERDSPNSNGTAIMFGKDSNQIVLGPVFAVFELQSKE